MIGSAHNYFHLGLIRQEIEFADYLLSETIIHFIFGLVISISFIICFRIIKRLDFAIITSFIVACFLCSWTFIIANLNDKIFNVQVDIELIIETVAKSLIFGFLKGLFFYIGYLVFIRSCGLAVKEKQLLKTGEDISSKTNCISKSILFIIQITITVLFFILCSGIFQIDQYAPNINQIIFLATLVSYALTLCLALILPLFIYRMWKSLQDSHVSLTPGKALGFLYIPVFNAYWQFKSLWGFSEDYNRLIVRHALNIPKLPSWIYLIVNINTLLLAVYIILLGLNIEESASLSILMFFFNGLYCVQLGLISAIIYLTYKAVNRIPFEIYRKNNTI